MKPKTLGEKVRARRKELHLTQEALCGGFITRNMLSRVETGDIRPSLETLCFLADRLSVPAGYLLSEDEDLAFYRRPGWMEEMRGLYRKKDWAGAQAAAEAHGLCDDEAHLMLCECAVRRGQQAYADGDAAEASLWFDRALEYAEKTVYHTEIILAGAVLCKAILSDITGEPKQPYLDSYLRAVRQASGAGRYLLERFLQEAEEGHTETAAQIAALHAFGSETYQRLAEVWLLAARHQDAEAERMLAPILDGDLSLADDPCLLFRCVSKMETVAAGAEDYKTAYHYAQKKQQLEQRLRMQAPETEEEHHENETDDFFAGGN